jgi:hypothetical protein
MERTTEALDRSTSSSARWLVVFVVHAKSKAVVSFDVARIHVAKLINAVVHIAACPVGALEQTKNTLEGSEKLRKTDRMLTCDRYDHALESTPGTMMRKTWQAVQHV